MSERASSPYQPRRDLPPIEDPTDPEALQAHRRKRIGERAKALMAAGYYPREDVVMISGWVAQATYSLVEIERLLQMAEWDLRSQQGVRPAIGSSSASGSTLAAIRGRSSAT